MIELESLKVRELLQTHAAIIRELCRREVCRSSNSPSGDYGEFLFARAFGWKLETKSSAGYDAVDEFGTRYQIKCRHLTPQNPSRMLGQIRRLDKSPFDMLAAVLLNEDYTVKRAALIPPQVVEKASKYGSYANAWRFILSDSVWLIPEVRDVTEELNAAESAID
jgi:hypothetical protein